jgi:sulfite oxidase
MINHPSRREMLATSSGLLLSGAIAIRTVAAQRDVAEKDLIFRTTDPRNAEPELEKLVQSWITPTSLFYVRSHAPPPKLTTENFKLTVEGMVNRPLELSLTDLKNFAARTTTATLTCAGNRRAEFNTEGKVGGVQWGAGAIGNATWAGVALAEVLKKAEVTTDAKHVWFEGLDEIKKGDGIIPFGGSIPIEKAMIADGAAAPLLAHTMNEAALTPDHGYPLRTVVPGYIGARSVKWLGKIVVSDRPSPNHYVATAYKLVKETKPLDWREAAPIYRFPVNAVICTPKRNSQLNAGVVELSGYALPTGRKGSKVSKVLISTDKGRSWTEAKLTGKEMDFCWQLWKANVNVTAATRNIWVRAEDSSGGFMPGRVPWNAKGYLQNSWYRQPVKVS